MRGYVSKKLYFFLFCFVFSESNAQHLEVLEKRKCQDCVKINIYFSVYHHSYFNKRKFIIFTQDTDQHSN